jgi:hypothetical protein
MESLQIHFASRSLGVSLVKAVSCGHCAPRNRRTGAAVTANRTNDWLLASVVHSRQSLSKWWWCGDINDRIGCTFKKSRTANHAHFQTWFALILETSQFEKCVSGCEALRAWSLNPVVLVLPRLGGLRNKIVKPSKSVQKPMQSGQLVQQLRGKTSSQPKLYADTNMICQLCKRWVLRQKNISTWLWENTGSPR